VNLAEFLARTDLKGLRKSGSGYFACCPAHEDRTPSLSIAEGEDGRVLLKCHGGCTNADILAALHLEARDLFADESNRGGGSAFPPHSRATAQPRLGCTLAQYAQAKGLPLDFLRGLGLSDMTYLGAPAIRVPYLAADGTTTAVRFRTALSKAAGGDQRFAWKSGDKPSLYGLQRLVEARAVGWLVLVEGESDTHTLWLHGFPALGLPGASTWRSEWAELLEGVERIYVVIEPDQGGRAMRDWLATSPIRERVRLIVMTEVVKDPSALYLSDSEHFAECFWALTASAVPWTETEQAESKQAADSAWMLCQGLAEKRSILDEFATSISERGVAGEARVAKLIYLALTSRLLDRPCSVAVKGPSGGGKSYLAEVTCTYFPESAIYALSGMSERALAYSKEPLAHRVLVLYEAVGMQNDFVSYLIRSLLSEGRIRYETVVKTKNGMEPLLIEREGPTGLLVTTTAVNLHPENETRLLSIPVTDSREQTAAVLAAIAATDQPHADDDLEPWRALQRWLETGERRVVVPFAADLAEMVPPVAVRLRRDFTMLLGLVRAHALLHRATRERDDAGRIVATLDDYAIVRDLVADLIAESVEATVATTVRETVSAVGRLHSALEKPVTYKQLGEALGLDKSAAQRRARVAIDHGYLKNTETRRGQPAQLVCAEPLPADVEILPSAERLAGCTVAGSREGHSTPSPTKPKGGPR
jgi:CHC2 zinc finger